MGCVLKKSRAILNYLMTNGKFDAQLLKGIEPVSGQMGHITFEMTVTPEHTDVHGTMHGGMGAYLVDALSTVARRTIDERAEPLDQIQTRFLRPALVGSVILIETETQKTGKNLYFANVDIKDKVSGALLLQGTHTKYMADKEKVPTEQELNAEMMRVLMKKIKEI